MYFYAKEGREHGPVAADRLVELFDRGVIEPGDKVRIDGTTSFREAARIVETLRGAGRPARVVTTEVHGAAPAVPPPAAQPPAPQPQHEEVRARASRATLLQAPAVERPGGPGASAPSRATLLQAPAVGHVVAPAVSAAPPSPHSTWIEAPAVARADTPVAPPMAAVAAPAAHGEVPDLVVAPVARRPLAASITEPVPPTLASAESSASIEIELALPEPSAAPATPPPAAPPPAAPPDTLQSSGAAPVAPPRASRAPAAAPPVARRAPAPVAAAARRGPPSSRASAAIVELLGGRPATLPLVGGGVALVALLVLFLRFTAELRGPVPPPGTKVRLTSSLTMESGRVVLKRGASTASGSVSLRQDAITVVEFLGPESFRLSFPVERIERVVHLTGQPPVTESRTGELAGRSVLVEGVEGAAKKTLEGAGPTESEQRRVDALVTDPRDPYPGGRAWPGRVWSVDPRWFCRTMTLDEACEGSAQMELLRFVRYRGERAAQIELHASVRGRHDGLTVELSLAGEIYRALDRGVDLESRAKGQLHLVGEVPAGADGSALMEIEGPITVVERAGGAD